MIRRLLVVLVVVGLMLGFTRTAAAEDCPCERKLGTLAPADSAWGKVFKAWSAAVADESNQQLKLTWYFNGSQGDEVDMVKRIRDGQLDGGAFTSTGLNQVNSNYGVFALPGLFPKGWGAFDAAREKMRPDFDAAFASQGFVILGTGDVGIAHIMTRGGAVHVPDDIKKFHPFHIAGDDTGKKMLEVLGVSAPKPLPVPQILFEVSKRHEGAHDIIVAPAIAADQLQWQAHFDNINTMNVAIGHGALIMDKKRFEGLNEDVRKIMERTGKNTGELLTKRIRGIDQAAFERFKANKTVTDPTTDELNLWAAKFKATRDALKAEGKFKADVVDKVTQAAGL